MLPPNSYNCNLKNTIVLFDSSSQTIKLESKWHSDFRILNAIIKFVRYVFRPNSRLQHVVSGLTQKATNIPEPEKAEFVRFINLFQTQAIKRHNDTLSYCQSTIDSADLGRRIAPIMTSVMEDNGDEKFNAEVRGNLEAFLKGGNLVVTNENFNDLVQFARIHHFNSVLELCDEFYSEDALAAKYNALPDLKSQNEFVNFLCDFGLPKTKLRLQTVFDRSPLEDVYPTLDEYRLYINMAHKSNSTTLRVFCCSTKFVQVFPQLTQQESIALASLFNSNSSPRLTYYPIPPENMPDVLPFAYKNNVELLMDRCRKFYTSERTIELIHNCSLEELEDLMNLMCDHGLADRFKSSLTESDRFPNYGIPMADANEFRRCIRIAYKSDSQMLVGACIKQYALYSTIEEAPEAKTLALFHNRTCSSRVQLVEFGVFIMEEFSAVANLDKRHPVRSILHVFDNFISSTTTEEDLIPRTRFQRIVDDIHTVADFVTFIDLVYDRKLDKTIQFIETEQFRLYCNNFNSFLPLHGHITFSNEDLPALMALADKYPERPLLRRKLLTLFRDQYRHICEKINYNELPNEIGQHDRRQAKLQIAAVKASTEIHLAIFKQAKQHGFHDIAKSIYEQVLKEAMALKYPKSTNALTERCNSEPAQQELKLKMEFIEEHIAYIAKAFPGDSNLKLISYACNRQQFTSEEFKKIFEHQLARYFIDKIFLEQGSSLPNLQVALRELIAHYTLFQRFAEGTGNQSLLDYTFNRITLVHYVYEAAKAETNSSASSLEAENLLLREVRFKLYPMFIKQVLMDLKEFSELKEMEFIRFDAQFDKPLEKTKFNDPATSDFVLNLKSGKQLFVHKAVLIANSSFFEKMFNFSKKQLSLEGEQKLESEKEGSLENDIEVVKQSEVTIKDKDGVSIDEEVQHEAAFIAMIQYFYSNQIDLEDNLAVSLHILEMIDKFDAKIKLPIYAKWSIVIRKSQLDVTAGSCIDWALQHEIESVPEFLVENLAHKHFSKTTDLSNEEHLFFKNYGHLFRIYGGFLDPRKIPAFCTYCKNIRSLHLQKKEELVDGLNSSDGIEGPRLDTSTAREFAKLQELAYLHLSSQSIVDINALTILNACPKFIDFLASDFITIGHTDVETEKAALTKSFPKLSSISLTYKHDGEKIRGSLSMSLPDRLR